VASIEWASDQSLARWLTQDWRLTTYWGLPRSYQPWLLRSLLVSLRFPVPACPVAILITRA